MNLILTAKAQDDGKSCWCTGNGNDGGYVYLGVQIDIDGSVVLVADHPSQGCNLSVEMSALEFVELVKVAQTMFSKQPPTESSLVSRSVVV